MGAYRNNRCRNGPCGNTSCRHADPLKLPASVTGRAMAGAARRVVTGRAAGTHGGRW